MKKMDCKSRSRTRALRISVFSVCLVLVSVSLAFCSAGGHGDHGQVHNSWLTIDTWKVLNFVVLVVAGFFLARKPVGQFFSSRTRGIEKELADLEQKRAEAEKSLAEYQEKFRNLDEESKQIVQDYIAQAEAAKAKILAQAKAQADKLEETAKHNIEQEFKAAREDLQHQVALQAVEMAEHIIRDSLTEEDQDKMIDHYLERLDQEKLDVEKVVVQ